MSRGAKTNADAGKTKKSGGPSAPKHRLLVFLHQFPTGSEAIQRGNEWLNSEGHFITRQDRVLLNVLVKIHSPAMPSPELNTSLLLLASTSSSLTTLPSFSTKTSATPLSYPA